MLFDLRSRGRLDRLNLSFVDDDRLIVFRGSAGAVDHAHVCEGYDFRVGANELAVGCLRERGDRKREEQENRDFSFHLSTVAWSFGVRQDSRNL